MLTTEAPSYITTEAPGYTTHTQNTYTSHHDDPQTSPETERKQLNAVVGGRPPPPTAQTNGAAPRQRTATEQNKTAAYEHTYIQDDTTIQNETSDNTRSHLCLQLFSGCNPELLSPHPVLLNNLHGLPSSDQTSEPKVRKLQRDNPQPRRIICFSMRFAPFDGRRTRYPDRILQHEASRKTRPPTTTQTETDPRKETQTTTNRVDGPTPRHNKQERGRGTSSSRTTSRAPR